MKSTIFYSWQSDQPNKINRGFIEDAIEKAISKLNKHFAVEEPTRDGLEVDKDTKDVPGSPPIADTIFQKISDCSIFVPDFTFIASSKKGRLSPNPNVLIEYGWALRELGHSRIVPVMNVAFGKPTGEALPFDLRHLRWPITYELPEGASDTERSTAKASLIQSLLSRFSEIIKSGALEQVSSEEPAFKKTPSLAGDISTFVGSMDEFRISGRLGLPDVVLYLPAGQHLFLRLIPTRELIPIRSPKRALEMAQANGLRPMTYGAPLCEFGRNALGAFAATYHDKTVDGITQLMLNNELWGIDTFTINKSMLLEKAKSDCGFIPTVGFEKVFLDTMTNYINFVSKVLNVPLPIEFVAGATDVMGYKLAIPQRMVFPGSSGLKGRIDQREIIYEGKISDYSSKPTDILKPFFNLVWELCGEERPDVEILN